MLALIGSGARDHAGAYQPIEEQKLEWQAAKRTFDQRCVVCHGCYDAPCQLKLSSWDGVARGATKQKVYEALRERFGVRRTDARFWEYSDRAHAAFAELEPLESGLFDYNRLDGR